MRPSRMLMIRTKEEGGNFSPPHGSIGDGFMRRRTVCILYRFQMFVPYLNMIKRGSSFFVLRSSNDNKVLLIDLIYKRPILSVLEQLLGGVGRIYSKSNQPRSSAACPKEIKQGLEKPVRLTKVSSKSYVRRDWTDLECRRSIWIAPACTLQVSKYLFLI